jgi:16S rRNA (adenine1518-N6/adenine1519-N6)-dimethyltransferase
LRKKGNKAYGILSVLVQAYDAEYLFTVDEHVFIPPPKVKSGVCLRRKGLPCGEKLFFTVVKPLFSNDAKPYEIV